MEEKDKNVKKEVEEEKIIDAEIIEEKDIDKEEKTIDKKEINEEEKIIDKEEKNIDNEEKNSNNSFFKSKIFLSIIMFLLGALIMYGLIMASNKGLLIQKVTSENIKTTTVEEESDLKTAINNVYEATVYINVSSRIGSSSGSGFIYKKDDDYGYILTNYHVIKDGTKYLVTLTDNTEVEATLISGDEYYDIAILKIDADKVKKVATLGNSSNLELGDTVFTVGAPFGKEYMGTITKGIVSGVNRMLSSEGSGSYLTEVIQTDASINSGNSGGPICNIKGEVVGITSSKLMGNGIEGMGFAIPINSIIPIIDSIENGKKIERPYLGIQLVNLTNTFMLQYYYGIKINDDVEFGAVISYVEEGKSADEAGLELGDVIVDMDGEKVEDTQHFQYLLYKHKIGDKIKIKYYRNNKLLETTIELKDSIKNE